MSLKEEDLPIFMRRPPGQRLIGFIFLAAALLCGLHIIFWRDFFPARETMYLAVIGAGAVVLPLAITMLILSATDRWKYSYPAVASYGPVRKLLVSLFVAPFMVLVVWIAFAYPVPRFWTSLNGIDSHATVVVRKHKSPPREWWHFFSRRSRRGSICDYSLFSPDSFLFRFCINGATYQSLPDGPFKVEAKVRTSAAGMLVKSLSISVSGVVDSSDAYVSRVAERQALLEAASKRLLDIRILDVLDAPEPFVVVDMAGAKVEDAGETVCRLTGLWLGHSMTGTTLHLRVGASRRLGHSEAGESIGTLKC